jgi:hypothetical protein
MVVAALGLAAGAAGGTGARSPAIHIPASVCVEKNGVMSMIQVDISDAGDTTLNGRPLHDLYPTNAEYASVAQWYIDNDSITYGPHSYVKFGLPRVLGTGQVVKDGMYRTVPVFVAAPGEDAPGVLLLPIDPWCTFQPYQLEIESHSVRG